MKIIEAFEKLEISPNSNLEDVLSAYRTLSKVWHPDRFTSGSSIQKKAELKQREINKAFEILKKAFEDGYQPTESGAGPDNNRAGTTAIRTFDAVYMGGDPRATRKKTPCKIILTNDVFAIAFNEDRILTYPKEDIKFMSHGNGRVYSKKLIKDPEVPLENSDIIHISFIDPEQVVPPFLVKLKLQGDYFAKVLKKYMLEYYALKNLEIYQQLERTKQAEQAKKSEHEVPIEANSTTSSTTQKNSSYSKEYNAVMAAGGIFVAFIVFILFLAAIEKNNNTESTIESLPSHAITKGNYSIWTEPPIITGNQVYKLNIAVPVANKTTANGGYRVIPNKLSYIRQVGRGNIPAGEWIHKYGKAINAITMRGYSGGASVDVWIDGFSFKYVIRVSDDQSSKPSSNQIIQSTSELKESRRETTRFFEIPTNGKDVVYVIDCTNNVNRSNGFQQIKAELVASLERLKSTNRFQILFFDGASIYQFKDRIGKTKLQAATDSNLSEAKRFITEIVPIRQTADSTRALSSASMRRGGSEAFIRQTADCTRFLYQAISYSPDVIFFLADSQTLSLRKSILPDIQRKNHGRSVINCIEINPTVTDRYVKYLELLASQNKGIYRSVKQ